ncbi:hypothetical protein B0H17DRAFT_1104280 [Mycena rosella]|uniref:ATP synthase subunit delta, mitochondrial n=1 Tax=Mycena rosella TaxID=1033263 RepID=A0AAD7CCL8_MYCRO|nr:hypothetical protein B0H17DRAFT_1104280 [Mycena rosella]
MSSLRLLASAARRAPAALALGRRGYAEATDKIKLTLVLPIKSVFRPAGSPGADVFCQPIFTSTDVVQPLRPGVVEVIESTGSKKWFVSGGFATVHPGNTLTVNVVEAAPLEDFSNEEALRVAAGNGSEEDKLEARIEADVYEALQHALSK